MNRFLLLSLFTLSLAIVSNSNAQDGLYLKGQLPTEFSQDKISQAVWMIKPGGLSSVYATIFFISEEGHFLMANHTFQKIVSVYKQEYAAYGNRQKTEYEDAFDAERREYYQEKGELQFKPAEGYYAEDLKFSIPIARGARIEKKGKSRGGLITHQKGSDIDEIEIIAAPAWDSSKYNDLYANKDFVIGKANFKPKAWLSFSKKPIQEGDVVYVAGYPMDAKRSLRFTTGKVTSVVTNNPTSPNGEIFLTDIDGREGMSGSPTLDKDGNIVGIFYGGDVKETGSEFFHFSTRAILQELHKASSCRKAISP